MAHIYREAASSDLIIRISGLLENDPRGVAERLEKMVMDYLAEEFLKKYKDGILGALNADDIAYKLNDAVAELVRRKLLEGTNESA